MKRRDALLGAGLAAFLAASASTAASAQTAPALEPEQVVVVGATGDATVSDVDEKGALVPSSAHGKWALGVLIGSAMAGLVSLLGFNGLAQMLAPNKHKPQSPTQLKAAKRRPVVRHAARAAGKALKQPGNALLGAGAITVLAILAVALLDLGWKANLALSAVSLISGATGIRKFVRKNNTLTSDQLTAA